MERHKRVYARLRRAMACNPGRHRSARSHRDRASIRSEYHCAFLSVLRYRKCRCDADLSLILRALITADVWHRLQPATTRIEICAERISRFVALSRFVTLLAGNLG